MSDSVFSKINRAHGHVFMCDTVLQMLSLAKDYRCYCKKKYSLAHCYLFMGDTVFIKLSLAHCHLFLGGVGYSLASRIQITFGTCCFLEATHQSNEQAYCYLISVI